MQNIIYKGFLANNPFEVKQLGTSDLHEILSLQEVVMEALPDKDILQPLSEEEFLYILNGNGLLIGAYVDKQLIAFRAVVVPKIDEHHLGYDLGFVEEHDLKRIMYQEISNVHPLYRGHGLQKTLAKVIMSQIDTSKYDYICSTVMPYNIASLKDKFVQGFYIVAIKHIYGGKLRYVFALGLKNETQYENETIAISMGDIEGQEDLIKQGYVGVSMKQVDEDWFVHFKKLKTM
ncbi:GNAT family N-acetyltransferase [Ureibacillus manganicus]|uniref:GNAT family N-acetyltransferase n=1 Tax=Ureibacillus manganicus TaxID=1266064 RepID=UPI000ADA736A|nr:GNAT family N-acetyltransferase [Ureibacillus manganicus]